MYKFFGQGHSTKKEINSLVREYINKKVSFYKIFQSDEFYIKGKKYPDNVFMVNLGQKCNMSKLYSEYAVEKAFNSDIVTENKVYLLILMISCKILSEIILYFQVFL